MGAIASSIAALSPLGSGAIWKMIVKHTTLLNETCTTSPPSASFQMGKGRLAYFSPKCSAIIPLLKEYFPVFICCAVWLRTYDNAANEGTHILAKFCLFAIGNTKIQQRCHQLLYCAQWDVGAVVHRSAPLCKKNLAFAHTTDIERAAASTVETDCRQSGHPSHVVRLNARHAEFIRRR